jgi:hypothetical protein
MARKKKRRSEKRDVPLDDIKHGPIRHKEGLTPLLEELARAAFAKVGHVVCPTFEQWELEFMRDMHPWQEILIWEIIARTFQLYAAKHPEAAKNKRIVGTIVSMSAGHVTENATETDKELRRFYGEACLKRWLPFLETPYKFPANRAVVLHYNDIAEERDGLIHPNVRGKADPRRILADADIIVGMDSKSGEYYCIYGADLLEDGSVPEGLKTVVVRGDAENDTKELQKVRIIVEEIKGRLD